MKIKVYSNKGRVRLESFLQKLNFIIDHIGSQRIEVFLKYFNNKQF